MNTSLYLIAEQYRQATDTLAALDLDEKTVADTLDSIGGELEDKAIELAKLIRNLESSAQQISGAAQAMNERAQKLKSRAEGISQYLIKNLNHAGIKSIGSAHFNLTVRQNPPAVKIDPNANIPIEYMRQPATPPPEPDKERIKKALQEKIEVPGCQLVCRYHVEIK